MTIQRKYQLPNCTLLLEGLSEGINTQEARPVMSILVSAECRLVNSQHLLSGGRDFFESLVTAVSGYAQEFLSQVPHLEAHNKESGLVQLEKVDEDRHRLVVQPDKLDEAGNDANSTPTEIDLTTVQLFDLVEAVDQFFADSQTLPDLSLQLNPVSRRFSRSGQQLVQQAVPATVGASSLALAAIAFFLVPVPEVRPPQPQPQSRSESTSLATAPTITDPSQLVALNQKLYDQLKSAWKPQPGVKQDLIYRVGIAESGKIKGYVAVNDAANAQSQQTPLPSLLAKANATNTTLEPLAQFKVVFGNSGVQVQPWPAKK